MAFFFIALVFMYIGRKLGWALSRRVLYTAPLGGCILLCVVWGAAIAAALRGLIDWQQPGAVLRWIMGYALGAYVSVPNFGLFNERTMPPGAQDRHLLVSTLPTVVYVASSFCFAFLLPTVE